VTAEQLITFCASRQNVLWSPVTRFCVSVRGRMPTLLHGPGCNLGVVGDAP